GLATVLTIGNSSVGRMLTIGGSSVGRLGTGSTPGGGSSGFSAGGRTLITGSCSSGGVSGPAFPSLATVLTTGFPVQAAPTPAVVSRAVPTTKRSEERTGSMPASIAGDRAAHNRDRRRASTRTGNFRRP